MNRNLSWLKLDIEILNNERTNRCVDRTEKSKSARGSSRKSNSIDACSRLNYYTNYKEEIQSRTPRRCVTPAVEYTLKEPPAETAPTTTLPADPRLKETATKMFEREKNKHRQSFLSAMKGPPVSPRERRPTTSVTRVFNVKDETYSRKSQTAPSPLRLNRNIFQEFDELSIPTLNSNTNDEEKEHHTNDSNNLTRKSFIVDNCEKSNPTNSADNVIQYCQYENVDFQISAKEQKRFDKKCLELKKQNKNLQFWVPPLLPDKMNLVRMFIFVKHHSYISRMKSLIQWRKDFINRKARTIQRNMKLCMRAIIMERYMVTPLVASILISAIYRRRKKKASNIIKTYLIEFNTINKFTIKHIIHEFIQSVHRLQHLLRGVLAVRRARKILVKLYWEKLERKIRKDAGEREKARVDKAKQQSYLRMLKESEDSSKLVQQNGSKPVKTIHERWQMQNNQIQLQNTHFDEVLHRYDLSKRAAIMTTLSSPQNTKSVPGTPRPPKQNRSSCTTPRRTTISKELLSRDSNLDSIPSENASAPPTILTTNSKPFNLSIDTSNSHVHPRRNLSIRSPKNGNNVATPNSKKTAMESRTEKHRKFYNQHENTDAFLFVNQYLENNRGMYTGPLTSREYVLSDSTNIITDRIPSEERNEIISRTIWLKKRLYMDSMVNDELAIKIGNMSNSNKSTNDVLDIDAIRKLFTNYDRYEPMIANLQLATAKKWENRHLRAVGASSTGKKNRKSSNIISVAHKNIAGNAVNDHAKDNATPDVLNSLGDETDSKLLESIKEKSSDSYLCLLKGNKLGKSWKDIISECVYSKIAEEKMIKNAAAKGIDLTQNK